MTKKVFHFLINYLAITTYVHYNTCRPFNKELYATEGNSKIQASSL